MKQFLAAVLALGMLPAPGRAQQASPEGAYQPTSLPIRLEKIDEKTRAVIRELNSRDTSSYLVDTRPVFFQIQGVENEQDQVRYAAPVHRNVDVLIYALGEVEGETLVDYGWIIDANNDTVWKMTLDQTSYAGGDPRNRKAVVGLTLPAGQYRLRYKSDGKHANGDWQGAPPEYPFYYGITVFNMKAIEKINRATR